MVEEDVVEGMWVRENKGTKYDQPEGIKTMLFQKKTLVACICFWNFLGHKQVGLPKNIKTDQQLHKQLGRGEFDWRVLNTGILTFNFVCMF